MQMKVMKYNKTLSVLDRVCFFDRYFVHLRREFNEMIARDFR